MQSVVLLRITTCPLETPPETGMPRYTFSPLLGSSGIAHYSPLPVFLKITIAQTVMPELSIASFLLFCTWRLPHFFLKLRRFFVEVESTAPKYQKHSEHP